MSSCVKPQANFFPLSKAVRLFNFPFTAQIIPTMCVPEFSSNKHHKVTLLSLQIFSHNALITKRNSVTTSVAMSDDDVRVVPLDNSLSALYHTIGDVIRSRKKDDGLQYVAVMSPCVYKDVTLDVGDILHLQQPNKRMTLRRTNKNHLRCVVLSGNHRLTLPDHLQVQLRKCSVDVQQETRVQQLSDVAYSEDLPCLVTFPNTFNVFDDQGYALASETVLLNGKSINNVVIGCHRNTESEYEQNAVYIHTFPTHLMIELEMLHGEQPVAEFSASDLQEIFEQIKSVEGIDKIHHKFNVDDLDLSDYTEVNLEEDVYENYEPKKTMKNPSTITESRDYTDSVQQNIQEALCNKPMDCSNKQQKTRSNNSFDKKTKQEKLNGYEVVDDDFTSIKIPSTSQPKNESFFNNNNNGSNFLATKSFLGSDKTQLLADMAHHRRNTVLSSQKGSIRRSSDKNISVENDSTYEINYVNQKNKTSDSGNQVNVIKFNDSKPPLNKKGNSGYEVNEIDILNNSSEDMYSGYEVSPFEVEDSRPPLPVKTFKIYENI